jgi:hypothetical protein
MYAARSETASKSGCQGYGYRPSKKVKLIEVTAQILCNISELHNSFECRCICNLVTNCSYYPNIILKMHIVT